MPTPSPLFPAFTIDTSTHLYDIVGATVAGDLTGEALALTRVVFMSNIPIGTVLTYQGNLLRSPAPVYATVSQAGAILQDNGLPVALLANDPGLNVTGIQWTVSILVPTPGSTQPLNPWTFDAPVAGTVQNLSTTIPVPSLPVSGVVRGPKGDPVDGVALIGGELVFYVDGSPIGSPVDFVSATGRTYVQASAAATWIITNSLGRPARMVNVYIGNDLVDADVTAPNDSTSPITVTFATPQTGRAEIS